MADEIKINADAWNNLPQDQQEEINRIMAESGLGGSIAPDPNAPPPAPAAGFKFPGGSGVCKALCDIGGTFAKLQCQRLPPAAQPICIAAADAGIEFCKSKCK